MVVDLNTHTHNAALACLQRATDSAAAFASTSILFTFGTSEHKPPHSINRCATSQVPQTMWSSKHGGGDCGPKGAHRVRGWVACPRQRRRRPLRCDSCPAASRALRSCAGRTEPANTEQMNVSQLRKVEKREGGGSLRVAKGGTCTAASGGTGRHSSTYRTDCASPTTPSRRQPNQPPNAVSLEVKNRRTVEPRRATHQATNEK